MDTAVVMGIGHGGSQRNTQPHPENRTLGQLGCFGVLALVKEWNSGIPIAARNPE